MMREDISPERYSPITFLTIALVATCVVLMWLGWHVWSSYKKDRFTKERNFKIEQLRGTIIYLDEVLTMSARMAAATGNLRWEERYRGFEPKLDAAIEEAMKLAPEAYSGEAAAETDAANIKLVNMENQAFDLVRQGRADEAKAVLFSDEYEREKLIYAQGMTKFALHGHIPLRLEELRGTIIYLDEVLTMSARMAAATGNLRWGERYRGFEPKLDAAIKEAIKRAPEAYSGEAAAETDAANIKLVNMENQAFDLVRQGRADKAKEVLFSDQYEKQKRVYVNGMVNFATGLSKTAATSREQEKQNTLLILSSTILTIPVLFISLLFIFRAIRKWEANLRENNRRFANQANELAEINKTLDRRVADRTKDLGERVKELNCLYGISKLIEQPDISQGDIIQGTVDLIPPSWQYPEITCARIILEDQEYKTDNFKETVWKQASDIVAHGERIGTVEVCYLGEKPEIDEGPFMEEERDLIDALARRLAKLTEHKEAEETLRKSEYKYRTLLENLPQKIFIKDRNSVYLSCNENYARDLKIGSEEITENTDYDFFPKGLAEKYRADDQRIMESGKTEDIEDTYIQEGQEVVVHTVKTPIKDGQGNVIGILGIFWDITGRKQAEEQIKVSLEEKEVLLYEINHRVKNNMQVISSLLGLQVNSAEDEGVINALMEFKGRIQIMAVVHEMLHDSDSLSLIDFRAYISSLASNIFHSYSTSTGRVKLKVDVEDIKIGVKQATPLGLIANELITNSIKYAFPENRSGEIVIGLRTREQNGIKFVISDNGIGIPEDLDWRNTDSLGLKLVTTVAENQLDGTVSLDREKGTRFTVKISLEETK